MTEKAGTSCEEMTGKEGLRHDLQAVLGQLLDLQVQSVEAYAHFTGTRFTGMQRQLEDVVHTAGEAGAAVAELLRDFQDKSARSLLITDAVAATSGFRPGERCTTAAVNMITRRISLLIRTIRSLSDEPTAVKGPTADLLDAIADIVGNQALSLAAESQTINSLADDREVDMVQQLTPRRKAGVSPER